MKMAKHIIRFSSVLFSLIILSSCSHSLKKLYDGKEKNKESVAVIWVDWDVKISEIDGKKVDINSTWEQYGILPGKHTFTIEANIEESELQKSKDQNIPVIKKKTLTKNLLPGKCYYAGYHFLYPVSGEKSGQNLSVETTSNQQAKELLKTSRHEQSIGHNEHAKGSLLAAVTILSLSNTEKRKIHSFVFDIYDTEKGVLFNESNLKREHDIWGDKRYHNRCLKIYHGVWTMKKEL